MDALKDKIAHCFRKHKLYRVPTSHFPLIEREKVWVRRLLEELISKHYFYKVQNETAKVLTIIACHSDSLDKYCTIQNNLPFLSFPNNDIVIINSSGEKYTQNVREELGALCKAYYEIPNDVYMDFGKWNYVCRHYDVSSYDHVVFTNDSYFILGSVYHFFNKMLERNASLYGIVSSTEIRPHYQSYLFACRKDAVETLNRFYESRKHLIHGYSDLIKYLELHLADNFADKDCLLSVENMPTNQRKNIFFHNDLLYKRLRDAHILPLIKLRRVNMLATNYM